MNTKAKSTKITRVDDVLQLEGAIKNVLKYFSFFSYAPTFDQIHISLPIKVSKKKLEDALGGMVSKRMIEMGELLVSQIHNVNKKFYVNNSLEKSNTKLYAMRGEGILFKKRAQRFKITQVKQDKVHIFIQVASLIPVIQLIGLSGSCTMGNAQKKDDIDIFIISKPQRLWTARLTSIVLAAILLRKRWPKEKSHKDRICLNMYMSKEDMCVTRYKQTKYTAHEVVQMSPLIDKDETYSMFMSHNIWVQDFFPNYVGTGTGIHAKTIKKVQNAKKASNTSLRYEGSWLGNLLEECAKRLQLRYMRARRSKEYISDTQLWFFPEDYYEKLKPHLKK